jgi:hypothetical protein
MDVRRSFRFPDGSVNAPATAGKASFCALALEPRAKKIIAGTGNAI